MDIHLLNGLIWNLSHELVLRHGFSLIDNEEGILTLRKQEGIRVVYLNLMPYFYSTVSAEAQQELIQNQLQESVDWMRVFGRRKSALVHRSYHLYIKTEAATQTPDEELVQRHAVSVSGRYRSEAWVIDAAHARVLASSPRPAEEEAIGRLLREKSAADYPEEALPQLIERWHDEMIAVQHGRFSGREAVEKRGAPMTLTLGIINVVIWLLMTYYGGSTNTETLVRFGAKFNPLINQGEYWRFVTPVFLHIGGMHLWFNSVALLSLGGRLERILGTGRFLLIYFIAGIMGNAASYLFSDSISAGASGAIFGLMGAILYGTVKDPDTWGETTGLMLWSGIGMNLVFGFIVPGIDNYAHLGGLAGGVLTAALLRHLSRLRSSAKTA